MTVTLFNPNKVPFVITLWHKEYCENGGPCNCQEATITRSVQPVMINGSVSPGRVITQTKHLSQTLTIDGRATVSGLPDAIKSLSQVREALRTRVLVERANTPEPALMVHKNIDAPTSPVVNGEATYLDEDTEPRSKSGGRRIRKDPSKN